LFGTIWFEVTGGPDAQHLVLDFHRKSTGGEPLDPLQQDIVCYWRKAHFGGRYLMFTCPECHRPARVLYARWAYDRIWFSVAVNALASPISRQWATVGTAPRVASRSCALGSNGARVVQCRSNREVCMSGHTSVSWGCLPITRRCENGGRVTPENTDQISIVLICGGNAEIDSLTLVVGHFVDSGASNERRASPNASERAPETYLPISVIIGGRLDPRGGALASGNSRASSS
jgi:hypothetical protein